MLRTPPPAVLNLLIINGLVFLATSLFPHFKEFFVVSKSNALGIHETAYIPQEGEERYLASEYGENVYTRSGPKDFKPYQIVTYFWGHANFLHLFFNMLLLYSLGSMVEYVMNSKVFIEFYLFCGVFAGICLAFIDPSISPVLGASTAVSGIIVAGGLMYPEEKAMFWPFIPWPFPIKIKYFMHISLATSVIFFVMSLRGYSDGVSHFGHLAGMFGAVTFFLIRRFF